MLISMTSYRKDPIAGTRRWNFTAERPHSYTIKMFAIRRTITASGSCSLRQLSSSRVFLAPNASPLESALRDGLKTAMKSKDRPAATCIKVSYSVLRCGNKLTEQSVLADVTNVAKSSPDPSAPATQENVITTIRKAIAQRVG